MSPSHGITPPSVLPDFAADSAPDVSPVDTDGPEGVSDGTAVGAAVGAAVGRAVGELVVLGLVCTEQLLALPLPPLHVTCNSKRILCVETHWACSAALAPLRPLCIPLPHSHCLSHRVQRATSCRRLCHALVSRPSQWHPSALSDS